MTTNALPSPSPNSHTHSLTHFHMNAPQIVVVIGSFVLISLSLGYFFLRRCKSCRKPSSESSAQCGARFETPDIESKAAIPSKSAQSPSGEVGDAPTLPFSNSARSTKSKAASQKRTPPDLPPLKIVSRQQFELLPVAINPTSTTSPIPIPACSRSRTPSPSLTWNSSSASSTLSNPHNSSPASLITHTPRTTTKIPFSGFSSGPRKHSVSCASFESSYGGPGTPMSGSWDGSDSFGHSFRAIPVHVALQKRNEEIVAETTSLIKLPAKAHFEPLAQRGDEELDGGVMTSFRSL